MCGRFTLTSSDAQISAVLPGLVLDHPSTPRYNIAPTQEIAAVLNTTPTRLTLVRWGLIPSWAKDPTIGSRMINARAETLADKPAFRRPLCRQRCLILADGFFEWHSIPGKRAKTPLLFRLRSRQPFALAGLWDCWRPPTGEPVYSATIVTTTPNELVRPVHDRMPAILLADSYSLWLSGVEQDPDRLLPHLRPYPAGEMEAFAVSLRVNNPKIDDASCIDPAK